MLLSQLKSTSYILALWFLVHFPLFLTQEHHPAVAKMADSVDLSKDTGLPSSSSSDSSSSSSSSSSSEGEGEREAPREGEGERKRYSSDSSHDSPRRKKKRYDNFHPRSVITPQSGLLYRFFNLETQLL